MVMSDSKSSGGQGGKFVPFVAAETSMAEFTLRA